MGSPDVNRRRCAYALVACAACAALLAAADALACRVAQRCGVASALLSWDEARPPPAPPPAPCNRTERPRPFVVLSSPKSGTTWFRKTLGSHALLLSRGELLLSWSRNRSRPAWPEVEARLDAASSAPGRRRPGFVLMYEHLPRGAEHRFAAWCLCRGVSVVHLIRSSALESYWTLQAEVRDYQDLGASYVDSSATDVSQALRSNRAALRLDPAGARRYVGDVERRRGAYRRALKYLPYGTVDYAEVFYEDLVQTRPLDSGDVLKRRLDAVQAFLGVPPRRLDAGVTKRMHPGSCRDKIANWDEVAKACRRTEAVRACV